MSRYYREEQIKEAINEILSRRMIMAALYKYGIDVIDISRGIMEELSRRHHPLIVQITFDTDSTNTQSIYDTITNKLKSYRTVKTKV